MKQKKMTDEQRKSAIEMVKSGIKKSHVANYFQVSKQYISQLMEKENKPKKEKTRRSRLNTMLKQNRKKQLAHYLVSSAIMDGVLHPQPCEKCGKNNPPIGRKIIDAHHDDYDKPLQVRWLCRKHHKEMHKYLPNKNRKKSIFILPKPTNPKAQKIRDLLGSIPS